MKKLCFIPFRKIDVLDMCISHGALQPSERQEFDRLYQLIQSILHFEFHSYLDVLKDSYAPFDPDSNTREIYNLSTKNDQFVEFLEDILNKANYEKIPQIELEKALKVASLFKIKLQVDFTDYSEVLLYCRGAETKTEQVRYWFSLFSKKITFTNYDRVVICFKQKVSKQIKATDKKSKPGVTFLKLFRNVPKADLEMLFPNTQINMRTIDKLMIGIPAALSGGFIVVTKLSATIILLASLIGYWFELSTTEIEIDKTKLLILLAGVGTLTAYLWKQLNDFKNKKSQFMKTLTDNLYLKNLDNNAGVFHRVLDDTEEEECKEIIIAYYFILVNKKGISQHELDKKIQYWFKQKWNCDVNFEIEDAVKKLYEYKLISMNNNLLKALPIKNALTILETLWNNFFTPYQSEDKELITNQKVPVKQSAPVSQKVPVKPSVPNSQNIPLENHIPINKNTLSDTDNVFDQDFKKSQIPFLSDI